MNKNIKDYTHLYLGCKVEYSIRFADGTVIKQEGNFTLDYDTLFKWSKNYIVIKLILRPLSDMTEVEMKELYDCNYLYGNYASISEITKAEFCSHNNNLIEIHYECKKGTGLSLGVQNVYLNKLSASQFAYLLSKHFDLFGLIEAGLAIDKTTLK